MARLHPRRPLRHSGGDERHFSEKVVCLPESFQANDDRRPRPTSAVSREALGLPGHGLVLCNFNHSAKLTPEVFDIWMRLLKEIEGSVLWLLAANATAETNLRREAAARGVAPERIVAAPRTGYEEYFARYRLADLFLELVAVQRGHHGERSLWMGLPVVTCAGAAFASRMAGSLLHALGLSELVAHSPAAYEALALGLLRERGRLRQSGNGSATAGRLPRCSILRGLRAIWNWHTG